MAMGQVTLHIIEVVPLNNWLKKGAHEPRPLQTPWWSQVLLY